MKKNAFLKKPLALLILISLATVFILPAAAGDVRMIAPHMPPHFDKNGDGRIGDVIKAILQCCGHRVSFTIVPFGRHWKDYEDDENFDGLATAEADQTFTGTTTRAFIHLQDGATVLAASGLGHIASVKELYGKRVAAFPKADEILGIQADVPKFKSFRQRANRFDMIRPLFRNRIDAILADGLIMAHFIRVLRANAEAGKEPDIDPTAQAVFRRLFPAGPQRVYFRDEQYARGFDRCFEALLAAGDIERLARPYVDRYRDILGNQYPNY